MNVTVQELLAITDGGETVTMKFRGPDGEIVVAMPEAAFREFVQAIRGFVRVW